MRGRHARPRLEARPAAGHRREDAGPRRGDVDVGAEVGVAGESIVRAAAAARRRRAAARLAVEVAERRDRDHLGVGRRNHPGGVDGAVARRDDHRHVRVDGVADGLVVGVGAAAAVRATGAEALVGDIDRPGVGHHPVEPAEVRRVRPVPRVVEHLDGPQPHPGRHADHPAPVVQRADGSGDVRAVAVAVTVAAAVGAVRAAGDVEVRVRRDACVEHRHVRVDRSPCPVNRCGRIDVGINTIDSARQGQREGLNGQVGRDDGDVRVPDQALHRDGRDVAGKPREDVAVDLSWPNAHPPRLGLGVGARLQDDDDVSLCWCRGLRRHGWLFGASLKPPRSARGNEHYTEEDDQRRQAGPPRSAGRPC